MRVISPAPRQAWAEVVAEDRYAVAEQSPEWTDAICEVSRYDDASRLYEFPDGRRFVLPLVRRRGPWSPLGWYASLPAAWGIGGLIGAGLDREVVGAIVADLRELGPARISIRIDPLRAPLWAGVGGPGIATVTRRGHVVDLAGGPEAVDGILSRKALAGERKAVRLGTVAVLEQSGALLDVHYDLFLKSVERWSAKQREPLAMALWRAKRRDPIEKLQAMARHLGKDFCHFVASHDGTPVASIIVLIGPAAHYTRGAMDIDRAGPLQANYLLQATAIRFAAEQGCTAYHMGESGTGDSLARFKEKFGAVGHHNLEYRIERLPLTRADSAARTAVKRIIGFRDA